MKRILFIILTFGSLAAGAQSQYIGAPNTTVINRGKFRTDSAFLAPVLDTTFTPTRIGQLTFRPADTSFYASVSLTGRKWSRIGAGGSGADSSLFVTNTALNARGFLTSDSLIDIQYELPLTTYNVWDAVEGDSVRVVAINEDSLAVYRSGGGEISQAQLDDTASAIRADIGAAGITQSQLDDSTAAVRADFPTSVTTDATVINGSTNPVQGNAVYDELQLKVNISDTATMLAPYLKESDTTALSNRINLKQDLIGDSTLSIKKLKVSGTPTASKVLAGDSSWKTAAVIDTAGRTTGDYLQWDGTNYVHVDAPTGGTSLVSDSIQVVSSDASMTGNLAFNTTLRRLTVKTDSFYLHIPITDSVRHLAASGGGGGGWTAISPFVGANLTNTSNVWTVAASGTSGYGNLGKSASYLPASTNGAIRIRLTALDGINAVIGLHTSNTAVGISSMAYAVWLSDAGSGNRNINVRQSGTTVHASTLAVGSYVKINRVGSTITIEKSTDGTTWTVAYTSAVTTTAALYVVTDINKELGKLYSPEGENLAL